MSFDNTNAAVSDAKATADHTQILSHQAQAFHVQDHKVTGAAGMSKKQTHGMDSFMDIPPLPESGGACGANDPCLKFRPDPKANGKQAEEWKKNSKELQDQPLAKDSEGKYEVKPGDSIEGIARRMAKEQGDTTPKGIERNKQALMDINKHDHPKLECNPNYLQRGMKLNLPGKDALAGSTAEQRGDHLAIKAPDSKIPGAEIAPPATAGHDGGTTAEKPAGAGRETTTPTAKDRGPTPERSAPATRYSKPSSEATAPASRNSGADRQAAPSGGARDSEIQTPAAPAQPGELRSDTTPQPGDVVKPQDGKSESGGDTKPSDCLDDKGKAIINKLVVSGANLSGDEFYQALSVVSSLRNGDEQGVKDVVDHFKDQPESLRKIADALRPALKEAGVDISYGEIKDMRSNTSTPYFELYREGFDKDISIGARGTEVGSATMKGKDIVMSGPALIGGTAESDTINDLRNALRGSKSNGSCSV